MAIRAAWLTPGAIIRLCNRKFMLDVDEQPSPEADVATRLDSSTFFRRFWF